MTVAGCFWDESCCRELFCGWNQQYCDSLAIVCVHHPRPTKTIDATRLGNCFFNFYWSLPKSKNTQSLTLVFWPAIHDRLLRAKASDLVPRKPFWLAFVFWPTTAFIARRRRSIPTPRYYKNATQVYVCLCVGLLVFGASTICLNRFSGRPPKFRPSASGASRGSCNADF